MYYHGYRSLQFQESRPIIAQRWSDKLLSHSSVYHQNGSATAFLSLHCMGSSKSAHQPCFPVKSSQEPELSPEINLVIVKGLEVINDRATTRHVRLDVKASGEEQHS